MPNLPFPDDTWSFLLVPADVAAPKNTFRAVSGRVTFRTIGTTHQMFLTVDTQGPPVGVTYQSHSPVLGEIIAPLTLQADGNSYQFNEDIKIHSLSLPKGAHEAAICRSVTVTGLVPGNAVFVAVRKDSKLLSPKVGDYLVTGASKPIQPVEYCTLTVTDLNSVAVSPASGYTLARGAIWNKPSEVWPPTISWALLPNGPDQDPLEFTGVMTISFDVKPAKVSWAFGGKTKPGSPGSDDDWISTDHSDPVEVEQAKGGYA